MLEVTCSAMETRLGVDFAEYYRSSRLFRYVELLKYSERHLSFSFLTLLVFTGRIKTWS